MNSSIKMLSIFTITAFLAAGCGSSNSAEEASADEEKNNGSSSETVETTETEEETNSNSHNHENNHDHDDDNNHNHENNHDHDHDEETEQIYNGYFEDEQVEDRSLSDLEGDWQSVYLYLLDGELNDVFSHKAEQDEDMTEEEYKEYYEVGYETNVDRIVFEDDTVTFHEDGEAYSSEYSYDGYEILTYDAGNRGVRFIFERMDESEYMPQYIQFSDHIISPTKSDHYHLYWGDNREELLEEVTNWPTYYPSDMDGHEIAHEMIAH
ncbi:ZinT/AdcA family metal-binding protein [Salipaludibacillus sp. CF4.18]|uniref:ZinT/AdcA family metal-binding protein n=1 Tax=Salipaludibacillus sp. CF4.18 TaxID=3373081 RepID=UPI003EE4501F